MLKEDWGFYQGFAAALGSLAREHGEPSVAVDIMRCNGVSLQDLKDAGVEEFDLKPLRTEWLSKFHIDKHSNLL
jgi:hypothetical protein